MLLYANDWYIFPYTVRAGSNALVRGLSVTNVFGERFWIQAAGAKDTQSWQGWGLFANSATDDILDVSDRHVTVLSTAPKIQDSESQEVQWFIRDEMANMVWAIEHKLQGGTGEGIAGHERAVYNNEVDSTPTQTGGPQLRYQLETLVPEHWIPMLPVAIDPAQGDIALERGVVVRARPDGTIFTLPARGRVLNPTGVLPYRVREEEVTRAGTRVSRVVCRTRWLNGETFVWIARRKTAGSGEGSSGLKYDLAKFEQNE